MNLIRKYKISKLINQPVTGIEGEILLFINSWLNNLIPFKMENSTSIYYMNSEGLYVLEHNPKNKYLYVRWNGFWSVLESKYLIEYDDVQLLLKFMIEERLKQKVDNPWYLIDKEISYVEEAFKKSSYKLSHDYTYVEDVYNPLRRRY